MIKANINDIPNIIKLYTNVKTNHNSLTIHLETYFDPETWE